jgi:cyanate permease
MKPKKQTYFDLRKVIGAVFTIYGLIISGYGLFAAPAKTHIHSNLNLWWGLVLLIFGLAFLALSFWKPAIIVEEE